MPLKSNPNPFPLFTYDEQDAVLTGRRIARAILEAAYPPLSQREAPEPIWRSTRKSKKEGPK